MSDAPPPSTQSEPPSLRFALLVSCSPLSGLMARNASRFARTIVESGHVLDCVFFHQDGALTAQSASITASDDFNARTCWQALADEHGLDLVVCSGSAERRGLQAPALAEGFRLGGLGRWLEAAGRADRVLTFGAPLR